MTKYSSIETLRFIAVFAVVFYHIPNIGFGSFGVDLFFVISGFVMLLSTEQNSDNFFLKRLTRIFPTYFIFTIVIFFIAFNFPELVNNTTADFDHLIKSVFFVPFNKNGGGHYPLLFVGWTLNYEMFFYALFAISLMISKKYRSIISTILLTITFILCQNKLFFPLIVYSEPIIFEFVLGMIVYELIIMRRYKYVIIMFSLIIISIYISSVSFDGRLFYYGIPSAFIVGISFYFFENRNIPKLILTLGGASYSIYLIHMFVIQFFNKVIKWFEMNLIYQISASLLCLLFINLIALAVYRLIELPTIHFLRRLFLKKN
jgi:exopolysaccharide production protein ExoZ